MQKVADWDEPVDLNRSQEYGSKIINAIETAVPAVVYGSVKNRAYIENLPEDAIVEVACLVDGNGIHPTGSGSLPTHLAVLNRIQLGVQELAVRAVQTGNPEYVFQAMAMDPLTAMSCTLDEIRAMTGELLEAHKPWITCLKNKLDEKPLVYLEPVPEIVEKHLDPGTKNNDEADK
ncbi:MAG: hypothetical protein KAH21_00175 [Spirochaetaceae bacterium]|nr:hypothetical protein [Spirochaetaceae bacterium]